MNPEWLILDPDPAPTFLDFRIWIQEKFRIQSNPIILNMLENFKKISIPLYSLYNYIKQTKNKILYYILFFLFIFG